jgi:hypothetical protein
VGIVIGDGANIGPRLGEIPKVSPHHLIIQMIAIPRSQIIKGLQLYLTPYLA